MDRVGQQARAPISARGSPVTGEAVLRSASPTPRNSGVRMQSRSPLLALLAVIVLITSLPASLTHAAEPKSVTLAPLPPVETDDGRFGMVQGIVQPDLAWNA